MGAATRILASATVGSLMVVCTSAFAATEARSGPLAAPSTQAVGTSGSLSGFVKDDLGKPIPGAVVSALGASTTVVVSGADGRFDFNSLPPGPYLVRAHLLGYVAPRAQAVQIAASQRAFSSIALRRSSATVLAAGVGVGAETVSEPQEAPANTAGQADGGPTELTWRLRHARRGILKDVTIPTDLLLADDDDEVFGETETLGGMDVLGRAIGIRARAASGYFVDTPFSGQVNLLTSSSFNSPQQLFSSDTGPRSTAYARLGAPVGDHGDWTVRGAITQADISSWSVAGSYVTRAPATHRYNIGMAYSTQRYDGGNVLALRDLSEGSRNAGALYAYDPFTLSPAAALTLGVAYARYDYLDTRGLFSPRLEFAIKPAEGLRVAASLSRSALAPGAEEFAPPNDTGIWLPPQRTFSSLEPGRPFVAEQTTTASLSVEKEIGSSALGFKVFREHVDDQIATVFGADVPGQPQAQIGHYFVSNAGDANASGYSASLWTQIARRVRCSLEYTSVTAQLRPAENLHYLLLLAPSTVRPDRERLHDFSTAIETEVPETATRVMVLYRISDGFARPGNDDESGMHPRIDGRFDVQIRQSLPFMSFTSARWEMLLAVRNFFRQDSTEQSVYDELLVVRPPKRVVGGVTLRF
jgi:hypothetical protein